MKTALWTAIGRGSFMLLLAIFAMLMPMSVQAQDDAPERFRVVITDKINCDVIICFNTVGGGICSVFTPGTNMVVFGGEPFTIVDRNGIAHPISERIGCLNNILIWPSCCINICYTRDPRTGMPVLTVTRPDNPLCQDLL